MSDKCDKHDEKISSLETQVAVISNQTNATKERFDTHSERWTSFADKQNELNSRLLLAIEKLQNITDSSAKWIARKEDHWSNWFDTGLKLTMTIVLAWVLAINTHIAGK